MNAIGRWIEQIGDARMWMLMLLPAVAFVAVGFGGLAWSLRFAHQKAEHKDPRSRRETRTP